MWGDPGKQTNATGSSASRTRLMTSELRKMEGPQMIMAVFAPSRSNVPQRKSRHLASVSQMLLHWYS